MVLRSKPNKSSAALNKSFAILTSSGLCIFGLTIYIEPLREFDSSFLPFKSFKDNSGVIKPSIKPSKISSWPLPKSTKIAGFCIKWPTLRINSSERPGKISAPPSGVVYSRSGFCLRVRVLPPFSKVSCKSPFIKPNQLRYTSTFSSASTAAIESSQSWMAVIADSSNTSLMLAGSSLPTGWLPSIWISACRLLFFNKIPVGLSASPTKPANWAASFNSVLLSPCTTSSLPSTTLKPVASVYEPDANAKLSSKNFLA